MTLSEIPMLFNTLLLLVLVLRMVSKGLISDYRVFFGYLVFETIATLVSEWIILQLG